MPLGLNGLLYGTPSAKPPLGGWPPFHVCAVDLNESSDCPEVNIQPVAPPPAPHHVGAELLLGGLGIVAIAGAAEAVSNKSSTAATPGKCDGESSKNACGSCTCDYDTT